MEHTVSNYSTKVKISICYTLVLDTYSIPNIWPFLGFKPSLARRQLIFVASTLLSALRFLHYYCTQSGLLWYCRCWIRTRDRCLRILVHYHWGRSGDKYSILCWARTTLLLIFVLSKDNFIVVFVLSKDNFIVDLVDEDFVPHSWKFPLTAFTFKVKTLLDSSVSTWCSPLPSRQSNLCSGFIAHLCYQENYTLIIRC